ncbi:FapA family protein [Alicyclobacillus sendaiensis]|uniref:FapA family protein n=2 Tax=Alicyclobacillus sendaiensis TaxID=192387 RepID=UPI00350E3F24
MEDVRRAVLELEIQTVRPEPLGMDKILEHLQSMGYVGTPIQETLEALAQATEEMECVVLRGTPPQLGRPARYRRLKLPKVYDPLRRRMEVASVLAGMPIAIWEPGIPAVPGRDVFGHEVVPPKHPKPPELGPGVIRVHDHVIAARSGRVVFSKERIDVVPELVIDRDLSSKDGIIDFDGDVLVFGSVLDGCVVQATGNVRISGNVFHATVRGERGVWVRGAIVGSHVMAGGSQLVYDEFGRKLKQSIDSFRRFESEYRDCVRHVQAKGWTDVDMRRLIFQLLTSRHAALEQTLLALTEERHLSMFRANGRYPQLVQEIRTKWVGIGRSRIQENDVRYLSHLLRSLQDYLEQMKQPGKASVRATAILSSVVKASGDIAVVGSGTLASSLEAGHAILVRGNVRGGHLVACRSISIGQMGTAFGTETHAYVRDATGRISIRVRYPNTYLRVGDTIDQTFQMEQNVLFGEARVHASHRRIESQARFARQIPRQTEDEVRTVKSASTTRR